MSEVYIAHNTYPLVLSSTFFLLPCVYSVYCKSVFFTIMLVLTYGVSANYWRKATYGFRRNVDLIFSKISFSVFFYKGFVVVVYGLKDTPIRQLRVYAGFATLFSIIYFYYLSERTYHRGNPNWIYYHMLFHMFVGIEQLIILQSITN